MVKIYDFETARKSILQRRPLDRLDFPPQLVQRTAAAFGGEITPPQAVAKIIADVRAGGDAAVRRWSRLFDNFDGDMLLEGEQLEAATGQVSPGAMSALAHAASRIRAFHSRQPLPNWETRDLGGLIGQKFTPVDCAGVYVPGGSAPLPSSLLMSVIPAQVAGVREIVVCTPPPAAPAISAAARVCGLKRLYQVGGAQAIAAMAFGTESLPRVDKIVGAGNIFVTLAKQQLFGVTGLDGLAGPTETMIIADETANAAWLAADLLAQAEHDPMATAILLTPSVSLARAVQQAVAAQARLLPRCAVIAQALAARGGLVIVDDLAAAAAAANAFAPEHLCLSVADPQALARDIRHAGGLFIGEHSFEVLGDYVAGPSHVMPTAGTARFASPLNVYDFGKITSVIALDEETGATLSPVAAAIARLESLDAHAAAAVMRKENTHG